MVCCSAVIYQRRLLIENAHKGGDQKLCFNDFGQILQKQIDEPGCGDERIGAYAAALQHGLAEPGPLGDFLQQLLHERAGMGASHLFTQILRATQNQLYNHYPSYPEAFLDEQQWADAFDWILSDPGRINQFTQDIQTRPLQSNVPERYKGLKAFIVLARKIGRISTCSVLDIGCSQNAGLKQITSGLPFEPPQVVVQEGQGYAADTGLSTGFQKIINAPLELKTGVGVDLHHPEAARSWAWSCSFNPSKLLDPQYVAIFKALITTDYPNIHFFKGDFSDFDHAAFADAFPKTSFDIVHISTTLYQLNQHQRKAILKNAYQYANQFIVVQDFLRIDPTDPTQLQFRNDWQDEPFPYRTVACDVRDPSGAWHDIFWWTDGRCSKILARVGHAATHALNR